MSTIDSTTVPVEEIDCRKIRRNLPEMLLEDLDRDRLSSLLQHLGQCRSCLKLHIAFQAAAELASPLSPEC